MSKLQRVILSICSSSCQTGPPVGEPITLPIMQQLANAVTCRRYIRHLYSGRPPLIIVLLSRPAKCPRVNRFCLPLTTVFHKPLHRFYVCVFRRNKKQVIAILENISCLKLSLRPSRNTLDSSCSKIIPLMSENFQLHFIFMYF